MFQALIGIKPLGRSATIIVQEPFIIACHYFPHKRSVSIPEDQRSGNFQSTFQVLLGDLTMNPLTLLFDFIKFGKLKNSLSLIALPFSLKFYGDKTQLVVEVGCFLDLCCVPKWFIFKIHIGRSKILEPSLCNSFFHSVMCHL